MAKGGNKVTKQNIFSLTIVVLIIVLICMVAINGISYNDKTYISGAKEIKTGLDISGGINIVYEAKKDGKVSLSDLKKAEAVLRKRLELKNIFDYIVRSDEDKGHISIEVPVKVKDKSQDPLSIVEGLDKTAVIEFRSPTGEVIVAGTDIASATTSEQPTESTGIPNPHVVLEFNKEGQAKFAKGTEELTGQYIAIYLDNNEITVPYVTGKIDSSTAIITMGTGTNPEKLAKAKEYAMLIDSGALPFSLEVINKEYIGPYIGQQALEISVMAGIIGFILVVLFMIAIYRLPGLVASIALSAYVGMFFLILSSTGIVLTLPGIAGLILSIGMAVDANVIIFERLKEELKTGRTSAKAFELSFKNAMRAIIDSNITTLIVATLLYIFGIGTVKGFGIILAIGVTLSMFTAVVVTKYILKQVIGLEKKHAFLFGLKGGQKNEI